MTDEPGSAGAPRSPHDESVLGDPAAARFAAIMRHPRRAALSSVALATVAVAVNVFVLEEESAPLFGVAVLAALVSILALWNVVNYSPTAMARLERLSLRVDGQFALWKVGTGGYAGTPFAYGVDHQRFGVLNYVVRGMPVEIGHLASQVSDRMAAPTGRRHAYVVVRLPERLPHMIVSFGHLSKVLGVRFAPDQWHRSQLVDVGGGRRFRLFVADGGEQIARNFFTAEMVQLFHQVGHHYDVEIKERHLYLFASRSAASGSDGRWHAQQGLIETLTRSMADSRIWELVRRQSRGRRPAYGDLRADVARAVTIVMTGVAVAIVVCSLVVLKAAGLLE
jgi:hypothetical protein